MRRGRRCTSSIQSFQRTIWAVLALAALAAISLALAACGSSSPGGGVTGAQEGDDSDSSAGLPPAKVDVPQLTWALPTGEPNSIAPFKADTFGAQLVAANLCDSIGSLNAELQFTPRLATITQPDKKTVVLKVRSGVKFWDGSPLTAADVVYSLKRNASSESVWGYVFERVRSIEQTGPNEVTVKFTEPEPIFPKELATPAGSIYEASFAKKSGKDFGNPDTGIMCSGPFEFQRWNPGSDIQLTKNPSYWDPKYAAHSEKLTLDFVEGTSALSSGLASGTYDGAYEVAPSVAEALESASTGQVVFGEGGYLLLQPTKPGGPASEAGVRRALATSLELEGISQAAYLGHAEPNYTSTSKVYWKTNPVTGPLWSKAYGQYQDEFAYDPQRATKMLGESDYSGQTLRIGILAGDETQAAVAQLVQQNAEAVGIKIDLEPMQSIPYAEAEQGNKAQLDKLDLILEPSYFGVVDPLELRIYLGPQAYFNYVGFENPRSGRLFEQAEVELDEKKASQELIRAQSIYMKELPLMTILNTPEVMFLKDGLTGATTSLAYLYQPSLALIGASE